MVYTIYKSRERRVLHPPCVMNEILYVFATPIRYQENMSKKCRRNEEILKEIKKLLVFSKAN